MQVSIGDVVTGTEDSHRKLPLAAQ